MSEIIRVGRAELDVMRFELIGPHSGGWRNVGPRGTCAVRALMDPAGRPLMFPDFDRAAFGGEVGKKARDKLVTHIRHAFRNYRAIEHVRFGSQSIRSAYRLNLAEVGAQEEVLERNGCRLEVYARVFRGPEGRARRFEPARVAFLARVMNAGEPVLLRALEIECGASRDVIARRLSAVKAGIRPLGATLRLVPGDACEFVCR